MATKKKSFKDAVTVPAAERFITAAVSNSDNAVNADNTQYTHKTDKRTKARRVQLLVYPDTFDAAKKVAYMQTRSINDVINTLLADYVEANKALAVKFDEVFNK